MEFKGKELVDIWRACVKAKDYHFQKAKKAHFEITEDYDPYWDYVAAKVYENLIEKIDYELNHKGNN